MIKSIEYKAEGLGVHKFAEVDIPERDKIFYSQQFVTTFYDHEIFLKVADDKNTFEINGLNHGSDHTGITITFENQHKYIEDQVRFVLESIYCVEVYVEVDENSCIKRTQNG